MKVKEKNKQDKSDECRGCGTKVKKGDNGMNCELCNNWFHCACENITDEVYNVLKTAQGGIHWFCKGCDRGVFNILKSLSEIEEKQKSMEIEFFRINEEVEKQGKGIEKLNKNMWDLDEKFRKKEEQNSTEKKKHEMMENAMRKFKEEVKEDMEKQNREMVRMRKDMNEMSEQIKRQMEDQKNVEVQETLWSDIVNKHVEKKFGTVQNEVEKVQKTLQETKIQASEERDKEGRRNNIIIYKAVESKAENIADRHKEDVEFCYHLVRDVLEIDCVEGELKKIVRLGIKNENERPLLIEFNHREIKNVVMETLGKLRSAEERFKRISIVHDMTKKEREEVKTMVADAREQQAQDESGNWVYRVRGALGNMRVVKMKRF